MNNKSQALVFCIHLFIVYIIGLIKAAFHLNTCIARLYEAA